MRLKSRLRAYIATGIYIFVELFLPRIHRNNWGQTRVLLFHHLDKPAVFKRVLMKLQRRYNIISFTQYLVGDIATDKVNVIISFDDGYESWYTNGLSLFKEFAISPLFFINSDFVEVNDSNSFLYCESKIKTWPEKPISWSELRSFLQRGFEIGGHGLGHTDLTGKGDAAFKADLVVSDRRLIAEKLGYSPRSFSYPYGRYDESVIKLVAAAGYQYAFTSDSGFLLKEQFPCKLKRTNIGMRTPIVVCALVEGWGEHLTLWAKWLRKLLGISDA